MQSIIKKLKATIAETLKNEKELYINAQTIIQAADIAILCYGPQLYEVLVSTADNEEEVILEETGEILLFKQGGKAVELNAEVLAAAMHVVDSETARHHHAIAEGRSYTRTGNFLYRTV